MTQHLRAALPGHEFNFKQPHGSSQLSIMGPDVLFWHKGLYTDRAHINIYMAGERERAQICQS